MPTAPRITIVTSSFNQGRFIGRTIESVLRQNYPNLEHIVVDGMSTDETADVLARYPHLRVIREPDRGQADAINKGFRIATGEIFGFLNSDDTLEDGALAAVAAALDPARGRHIVMGRCRFIDEHDRFLGIEHPSAFESHERVLAIWKGHMLPQPAVFWSREVWERCGPLDEQDHLMLDYDLFCRFSRSYFFHPIDAVVASYRLHTASKTESMDDRTRLASSIAVSRRYWGSKASPRYWRLWLSHALFKLDRRHRASRLMTSGRDAWRRGERAGAIPRVTAGALLGPDVALDAWLLPGLGPAVRRALAARARLAGRLRPAGPSPQSLAWRGFVDLHADGWAGPELAVPIDVPAGAAAVVLEGKRPLGDLKRPLDIEAFVDGVPLGKQRAPDRDFSLSWPLPAGEPGPRQLRLVASAYTVPHDLLGNQDYRPLAYKVVELRAAAPHADGRDATQESSDRA